MLKHKSTIILCFSIIAMALSITALCLFYRSIQSKNEHTDKLAGTLEQKMIQKSNSVSLAEKSAKFEQVRQSINSHFVNADQIDSFVNYLESLGASAGSYVNVENFDISTTSKNTMVVRVTTEGTFSNVMRVLMLIENAPYKLHVQKALFNHTVSTVPVASDKAASKDAPTTKQVEVWKGDISFSILLS